MRDKMKDYAAIILILFLAFIFQRAGAQQTAAPEPYSIKADKLGEIGAEWLASDPTHKDWKCMDVAQVVDGKPIPCLWERAVYPKVEVVTYAGLELTNQEASFVKKDGKVVLYQVKLQFCNGDGYEATLIAALNEKFGTASHKITPLQNGFGATITEDTWTWTNGVSTVTLDYTTPEPTYHSPVVTFTLDSLAREIQERQDKAAQKRARSDM
jgi:hypothetical protein